MAVNNTQTIKRANTHLVFNTILKYEPLTTEDIIRSTDLSRPTVIKILNNLLDNEIIQKVGFADTIGGRKPILYSINRQTYYAIGIDIEIPPIRLVIADIKGNIVFSDKWVQKVGDTLDDIADMAIQHISHSIFKSNLQQKNIIGIGLGIPGTINTEKGKPKIILRAKNESNDPIQAKIQNYFGIPAYINNDCHNMARSEKDNMKLLSNGNFIFIAYRSGIGMSVFVNGLLYKGDLGAASYIGHTTLIPNGIPCECGNKGCLERYCSKPAIVQKYCLRKDIDPTNFEFTDILLKAKNGDQIATEIFIEAGEYLGICIADMVKLFDIHTILIGGSDCEEDSIFFQTVKSAVDAHVFHYLREDLNLFLCSDDEYTSALGSALLVLDEYFKEPRLELGTR